MVRDRPSLAIVPAHNEEARIARVVNALPTQGLDVLVVDDASSDRTASVARSAGARVVRLCVNLGYGGALQTGYSYAVEHGYPAVVQLDGDGQHDPACARALLEPVLAGTADVVLGSRFLTGPTYPVPRARRIGQRLFGAAAGFVMGRAVTDPTTGYQALSREVVEIYCNDLFPTDYPDADMLIYLHRLGMRILEVPVRVHPATGPSMHGGLIRPLYYIYKMSLAMLMARFRTLPERVSS